MGEVFEITDAGLAEAILSRSYGKLRIDSHGRPVMVRLTRAQLGPSAQLDHASFSMSFSAQGDPLDALHVNHLRSGQVRYDPDGSERSYGPGDVFLAVQPGHRYTTRSQDADVEVTVIDPALLSQVAGTGPGQTRQPVRLTGYDPVSAQAAGQWRNTLTYVRGTVLASPDAAAMPLLVSTAARLLAATALAVFPSNVFTDPTSTDRHDAHRGTVRRAVAFIDEHACADITIADIAAAAFVTIRAVQLAFRRHLGTTRPPTCAGSASSTPTASFRPPPPPPPRSPSWPAGGAFPTSPGSRPTTGRPTASLPATPSTRIHDHPHDRARVPRDRDEPRAAVLGVLAVPVKPPRRAGRLTARARRRFPPGW